MLILSKILIAIIAVEHFYILWIEMFAWTTAGKKTFRALPEDIFEKTKVFAANQGLYNGFLAVGLVWSLLISDSSWSFNVSAFFLGCIIVAGIYGGLTVQKSVFYMQAVPALLAMVVLLINKYL